MLRQAGADQVLVASRRRWALMVESQEEEPRLGQLLAHLERRRLDLVLAERFGREPVPKLEVHRAAHGSPMWYPEDPWLVAVASDERPDSAP